MRNIKWLLATAFVFLITTAQAEETPKQASIFKLVNVHSTALAYYVKCTGKTVSLKPNQEALLVQNSGYMKTLMANKLQQAFPEVPGNEILSFIVSADEGMKTSVAKIVTAEGCSSKKLTNFPNIVGEVVAHDVRQQLIDAGTPEDQLPKPVEPGVIKKMLEKNQ